MSIFHEPTNADRAEWARNAMNTFAKETFGGRTFDQLLEDGDTPQNSDGACAIGDLIADLLHLARKNNIDPQGCINSALMHFEAEEEEEANEDGTEDAAE
mgnify:CR=1 FL=1